MKSPYYSSLLLLLFVFSFPPSSHPLPIRSSSNEFSKFVISSLNSAVAPCENFYQFSCGGWLNTSQIPAGKYKIDKSFTSARQVVDRQLKKLLEQGKIDKASQAYTDCLDTATRNNLGAKPLVPFIKAIKQVDDEKSFATVLGRLHLLEFYAYWDWDTDADNNNASTTIISWSQDKTVSFDEKAFYFEAKYATQREGLVNHITNMLILLKISPSLAEEYAQQVLQVETELARFQRSALDRKNHSKSYNPVSVTNLSLAVPGVDWPAYFAVVDKRQQIQRVNLYDKQYFDGLSQVLSMFPLETHRVYLLWRVLHSSAKYLSTPLENEDFRFFKKELSGTPTNPEKWETCVTLMVENFEALVAQAYVKQYFGNDTMARVSDLLQEIEAQFGDQLKELSWMDNITKQEALKKLNGIVNLVGYSPTKYMMQDVTVKSGEFFFSILRTRLYAFHRNVNKSLEPTDRNSFHMAATDINAYYSSSFNQMAFPAGILQPPFYDKNFPDAFNFGAIGAVMGHELTHAFDDQGSKFDTIGNMQNWWQPSSFITFDQLTQCLVDEFSQFTLPSGSNLNGNLTLGENIADLGGLKTSYYTLKNKLGDTSLKSNSVVPGLTNEQLFFVSYAQLWCENITEKGLEYLATTNKHSPSEYRVNGILQNFSPFSDAFQCPSSSPLNPINKCSIW